MAKKQEKEQEQVKTGADVVVESKQEVKELPNEDLVQVAATHSSMNVNKSNGSLGDYFRVSEADMKRDVEKAAATLGEEAKKTISIPKQMIPYLGETMIACINGACIRVPIDGESYDIPESYYPIIMESMKTIHAGDVRDQYGFGEKVNDQALR